jgi:hypothetical protein
VNLPLGANSAALIERAKFKACPNIAHGPRCGRGFNAASAAQIRQDQAPPPHPKVTKLKATLTKKQICTRMPTLTMLSRLSFRLAVSDARVALPDFYNVAVGIANVAARLAVFGLWLGDELGPPASPQLVARMNIGNADIHEAAD